MFCILTLWYQVKILFKLNSLFLGALVYMVFLVVMAQESGGSKFISAGSLA